MLGLDKVSYEVCLEITVCDFMAQVHMLPLFTGAQDAGRRWEYR